MAEAEITSEDILRQCLQEMYPTIVVTIEPKGYILDSLFAKNTITLKEKRHIAGLPVDERGAELIDTLLTCGKPNAIAQFLEILSNDDNTYCKWIHDEVHERAAQKAAFTATSLLASERSSVPKSQGRKDLQSTHQDDGVAANLPTYSADGGAQHISKEDKPLVIVEFSKLIVGKIIGAGGYGEVYKAEHPDFKEQLAYKRIKADFIQKRDEIELKNEAKIHMRLDHPNIVKCFAVVFEPKNYGMILEFMKHGEATSYLIENNSLRSKLNIIKDVASGMKYLHNIKQHAVIHGDLKSENVLIGEDETAKVCDFGFSRWKEYSKSHSVQAVPLGTVTHVPPERWKDCNLRKNEMFDVYLFGITMWEILTLKSPFLGGLPAQIPIWVENGQRPDLRDIPAEVANNVVHLMVECWDGNREKRPPFEEILARLKRELKTL